MARTQNFGNHARYLPAFHFFASPVLLINAIVALWHVFREPSLASGWAAVVAVALFTGIMMARVMALTVQNRLIRLEQQVRFARILPADLQPAVAELRPRHFIGLRFASDSELPDLIRRIRSGELDKTDDIKKAVRDWQADYLRV
jgi:uncharacterized membrane protein YraQ (UPF0718 family)